jgi:hypothetical protein
MAEIDTQFQNHGSARQTKAVLARHLSGPQPTKEMAERFRRAKDAETSGNHAADTETRAGKSDSLSALISQLSSERLGEAPAAAHRPNTAPATEEAEETMDRLLRQILVSHPEAREQLRFKYLHLNCRRVRACGRIAIRAALVRGPPARQAVCRTWCKHLNKSCSSERPFLFLLDCAAIKL